MATHVGHGIVTDDAVWTSNGEDTLYRIDPATNAVVDEITAPGLTNWFDVGHGAAWIPDFESNVVRRVDVESGAVVAEIGVGTNPEGIDVTADAVWVANHRGGTVTRIDPATNLVVATIEVGPAGPAGPQGILASGDRVWTGVPNSGEVVGIDTANNQVVANVEAATACGPLAVEDEKIWVTSCFENGNVNVIDTIGPSHRGVLDVGGLAGTPLPIDGLMWIPTIEFVEGTPGRIVAVDPSTLEIVRTISVADQAYAAATAFDSVWLFSYDAGAVLRFPIDAFTGP